MPGQPHKGVANKIGPGGDMVHPRLKNSLEVRIAERNDGPAPLLRPSPHLLQGNLDRTTKDRDGRQAGLTPLLMAIE